MPGRSRLVAGLPIRSLLDVANLIELACTTDGWSQAFSDVRAHRLGRVFVAPLGIVIRRDPLRTRQADLMSIGHARHYVIGLRVIGGGLDLLVAISSPTNTRQDLLEKLRDYQTTDVREAWIVSPQAGVKQER